MANSTKNTNDVKAKKEVPATIKTIVSLVEVVARFLTAYLLLNNFDHIVAIAIGWYMLISAAMMFVTVFHKAFTK